MPQLNRDILREVFREIVKTDGSFKNIEKFMMAGKEPFQLVLDYCKKANDLLICEDKIYARLPIICIPNIYGDYDEPDTLISTSMALFKPISIAVATSVKFLDVEGFSAALIPMLKAIDQEMKEIFIFNKNKQLIHIFDACANIQFVRDCITIRNDDPYYLIDAMKHFSIPCRKLFIRDDYMYFIKETLCLNNRHLHNVRDLTIKGRLAKKWKRLNDVKQFIIFLTTNFPNLETFYADIEVVHSSKNYSWDWKDNQMVNLFKALPSGVKGSITYTISKRGFFEVDQNEYPNVKRNGNEYYQIYPVTNAFSMKLNIEFEEDYQDDDTIVEIAFF